MKIVKKYTSEVSLEKAHGGSGSRKLFLSENEINNLQAMTYGFLPINSKFEWHLHNGVNEIMLVIFGSGVVKDEDGVYTYGRGDFFVFPSNVLHEIVNTGNIESEMVFVRVFT